MITVKKLCKDYGDNHVLRGIDCTIRDGEKIVVIGPSGAGKSTFLRCLNLLEVPTSGEVWLDNVNITDPGTDINKIRRRMGMVFQHFNLFSNLTIMKNIALAPEKLGLMNREEANEKALELLKRVGLENKADAYPAQLSGGQKQRIAIVRSLAMNPEVMLFDEPTSALDPISTSKIEELALELKKDYTIIIVTHSMQQAKRISNKTAFFLLGEVIEFDETEKLFSNPRDERTDSYINGRFG